MADMADLIARAFTTAAGRIADPDRSFSVEEVTRRLAADLRPHFREPVAAPAPPADDLCDECRSPDYVPGTHSMPPVSPVDTPAQHVAWAAGILDEISHVHLGAGVSQEISEALSHVLRAAELIERDAEYLRDEAPPAVHVDMTGPVDPVSAAATLGIERPTVNGDDPVRAAALALLRRLENLTTLDFSRGREKVERDQLARALGIEP